MSYYDKYLKYKNKYLELKISGGNDKSIKEDNIEDSFIENLIKSYKKKNLDKFKFLETNFKEYKKNKINFSKHKYKDLSEFKKIESKYDSIDTDMNTYEKNKDIISNSLGKINLYYNHIINKNSEFETLKKLLATYYQQTSQFIKDVRDEKKVDENYYLVKDYLTNFLITPIKKFLNDATIKNKKINITINGITFNKELNENEIKQLEFMKELFK